MDFKKDIVSYYAKEAEAHRLLNVDEINEAMNCILRHYENESAIYVLGNGGSSATANHFVCDFDKGICLDLEKKFRLFSLAENIPIIMAIANDIGFEDVFFRQLEGRLKKEDLVIAISGSGNSHNVVKAVKYANEIGCDVISMTGYDGGKIKGMAKYHLDVPVHDMQIVEDVHMSFDHMIMKTLWKRLMAKEGKEAVYKINQ